MKIKFLQSATTSETKVEMIPLIDVVFLVLAAFIYASMFSTQKTGLLVDLPVASEAQTQTSEVLTLTITEEGTLLLDKEPILLAQLSSALAVAKAQDLTLFIIADEKAQLATLVEVMNLARKIGIKSLNIAARRTEQ